MAFLSFSRSSRSAILCGALSWLVTVLAICTPFVPQSNAATPAVTREHELKAAAFYNIIVFTEWPPVSFADPEAPLVIGVLGQDPVANLLPAIVANERWHGRRIVVERYATPAQITGCHVLYISRSEHTRWLAIRRQLNGRSVLTVADGGAFARDGGVVQFSIDRNKLKLTVNLTAARAGGLTISSKVLRLAEIIGEPTP